RVHSAPPLAEGHLASPLGQAVDSRITLRDLHLIRVEIIGVAAHKRDASCECELRIAFREFLLCQLASGDVDDNGNQAQRLTTFVVKNYAARLDPTDRAIVSAEDAKLRNEFMLLLTKRLITQSVKLCQIFWVHKFAGSVTGNHKGALR